MALLNFQMPEKVVLEKENDFFGRFLLRPLERGYGITVGNALRRVLLSSLEGFAITTVKIPGVDHEFSVVPGVVEDVTEIILNLKGVRLKKVNEGDPKIFVSVRNKEVFTAGDISDHTAAFEITNPDHVICHLDPKTQFDIELTVAKGRGYRPAEENKVANAPIGEIAIDSIFTPIRNVRYAVEDYRIEQKTDYEQLQIDVQTDGTIDAEDALKEGANILLRHLMLFSDDSITLKSDEPEKKDEVDENYLQMRKVLKTPLSELDLSVRAYNCLKAADIKTLGDLVSYNIADLLKFRNFGKKSLTELEELVAEKALSFGMDVSKFKLDED
ncbi:DNA-directed RNA polymerase subunit alpha [Pontibacter sp. G13]|uniref:DNA-directed RNA polymerase subunit alpha n=1 Tax=Pontibacter sp. G13 TaxID=3074898 RepID=UPI00288A60A0|nr:DNA-directed RNA polymerase subunit alpha [Pontibacter sp. G13]WNJ16543.1 DNA-directed RNA polymerase subunit alpha [Pontibacter sp. G13]